MPIYEAANSFIYTLLARFFFHVLQKKNKANSSHFDQTSLVNDGLTTYSIIQQQKFSFDKNQGGIVYLHAVGKRANCDGACLFFI